MKLTVFIVQLLFAIGMQGQNASIHIPESGAPVAISLGQAKSESSGFKLLTVRSDGHTMFFHPRNSIACAPRDKDERKKDLSWVGIEGMQLDPSLCFYRAQYGSGETKHTILVFVSEGGASDAAPVYVLGFSADGAPYKVLESEELDLYIFRPNPTNGTAKLIGFPTRSQVMAGDGGNGSKAPYATTYDPRSVYVIRPNQPAAYSLEETKRYNQQHYVWAGPKSREDYAVVYNYPHHPRPFGVPAKQLDALFAKMQEQHK